MPSATVRLDASLSIQVANATQVCGVPSDPGDGRLLRYTQSAAVVHGQKIAAIASPAAYVSLVADAVDCRLLWLTLLAGDAMLVRVTHATAGAVVYPVGKFLVLHAQDGEEITDVEVQGDGTIEWALSGG